VFSGMGVCLCVAAACHKRRMGTLDSRSRDVGWNKSAKQECLGTMRIVHDRVSGLQLT
jgi:hypothetical protein